MKTKILCSLAILILALSSPVASDSLSEGRISLDLEDMPLMSVLKMIAAQNDLNLVISSEVSGEVSLRLDDVKVETALDALLTANGLNYFLRDGIMVVKPVEADAAGELSSRIITLKYLSPFTAKKALETRLSQKGSVTILDKSGSSNGGDEMYSANRLLITDFPNLIDELATLTDELDQPERTLLIEARIIETKVDSKLDLGLTWPNSISATVSEADGASSSSGEEESGSSAVVYPLDPTGRWKWGKLSVAEVGLVLNALSQTGDSKLISDPRVTTLENHRAEFAVQTIVPIQTINRFSEGAATSDIVTFEDEEIGISLVVTPRINEGNKITLDIKPTVEDIIGYAGPKDNQKPITASRTITARITVEDGETVALGGLLKENEIETIQKVPLLGDIPLLGGLLFTSKKIEKSATDLVILVTPHILD